MSGLTELKGIGAKTERLFAGMGIRSQEDLLRHYPRAYEIFEEPVRIGEIVCGVVNAVEGVIRSAPSVRRFGGRSITILQLRDETGTMQVNWFNMPYLRTQMKPGARKIFRGLVIQKGNRLIMEHPKAFDPDEYELTKGLMLPIYPLTAGITNQMIRKAVRAALERAGTQPEPLQEELRARMKLVEINYARDQIHFPADRESCERARRRIVFDEFFFFVLGIARMRTENEASLSAFPMKKSWLTEEVIESLPFSLTHDQMRVWSELEHDMSGGRVMSRLIQGDVGSGKTILAFLSMLLAMENGTQSVMMAPTEVLARQHAHALSALLSSHGISGEHLELLVGSLTQAQKRRARERIASGEATLIIGTHALIQEGVAYQRLGLVITDEQHRFGVRQRLSLTRHGELPHVLVMSATPIPRTLAMMLYGDLDVSVIRERPDDRLRVKNALVDTEYRPAAYRFFRKEIEKGHQVYVVCPMVEASTEIAAENVTDYAEMLRREMGDEVRIGVLHGQLPPAKKNAVMASFAEGEIDLLVTTTVIEVGVDVPNATVMMIENAERFGLAQLHQLRGRVGRGDAQSYCIFVSGSAGEIPERLRILANSNDGFEIAEADLAQRGPGDLFGVRQSGEILFSLADIYRDRAILRDAHEAAQEVLALDPKLELAQHREICRRLSEQIQYQIDDEITV